VTDEGVDLFIHAADLVEARLDGFARGDFAFGQFGGQFGNGQLVEHLFFNAEAQRCKDAKIKNTLTARSRRCAFAVIPSA